MKTKGDYHKQSLICLTCDDGGELIAHGWVPSNFSLDDCGPNMSHMVRLKCNECGGENIGPEKKKFSMSTQSIKY